eukprot:403369832
MNGSRSQNRFHSRNQLNWLRTRKEQKALASSWEQNILKQYLFNLLEFQQLMGQEYVDSRTFLETLSAQNFTNYIPLSLSHFNFTKSISIFKSFIQLVIKEFSNYSIAK